MFFSTLGAAGGWATLFAAGLYNWAATVYGYNREGWMTDVQLKQQYEYQRDNMQISTHLMSREEVRDRTQAAITKLSNYILVTTLILSLSAEIMVEGRVPALSVDFILNVYMLCLGTSVLYLVLSILFGIVAINQVYEASADILTDMIPAAWKNIEGGMKKKAKKNLVRDFEKKPWRQIFTPPLMKRFALRGNAEEDQPRTTERERIDTYESGDDEEIEEDPEMADLPPTTSRGLCIRRPEDLQDIRDEYRKAFQAKEQNWQPLTSQSFECLALGVKNLLDVYGYLCMARLYSEYGAAWAFWAVMSIFTCLNVLLMLFLFNVEQPLLRTTLCASGPLLCCIAATTPYVIVDCWCVPCCYLSHFLLLILFSTPAERTQTCSLHECGEYVSSDIEDNGYERLPVLGDCELAARSTASLDAEEMDIDFSSPTKPLPKRMISQKSMSTTDMTSVVSSMVGIARNVLRVLWFLSFVWAVLKAFSARGFKNSKAVLQLSGPRLAHSELLETTWPSPYFSPHALVCPRSDVAFLADKFRVFRLDENHQVTTYPCDVNGTIADISADCDNDACWPMVLLKAMPPIVLECSTGKEYPLLQTGSPAEQFAVVNAYTLVAAHQGQIVQYSWDSRRKGWAPSWIISDIVPHEAIQALDVSDDAGRMLIFRRGGIVQLQDLKSGKQCGVWEASSAMMGAGCSEKSGKILKLLVRVNDPECGPQVRLMRSTLDGPQSCDQVNPDSVQLFHHGEQRGSRPSANNRWFN